MSPEAQRIAIAEACGHRDLAVRFIGDYYSIGYDELCSGVVGQGGIAVPDYLHDLNAMHAAVEHACSERGFPFQEAYTRELRRIVTRRRRDLNEMQTDYWIAEADAQQRAEALLRTLNLWSDT